MATPNLKKFVQEQIDKLDESNYWRDHASMDPLPPRTRCCHDCAVENGFYHELVESLKEQPRDIQERAARSWFCHTTRGLACKGALDALGVTDEV